MYLFSDYINVQIIKATLFNNTVKNTEYFELCVVYFWKFTWIFFFLKYSHRMKYISDLPDVDLCLNGYICFLGGSHLWKLRWSECIMGGICQGLWVRQKLHINICLFWGEGINPDYCFFVFGVTGETTVTSFIILFTHFQTMNVFLKSITDTYFNSTMPFYLTGGVEQMKTLQFCFQ